MAEGSSTTSTGQAGTPGGASSQSQAQSAATQSTGQTEKSEDTRQSAVETSETTVKPGEQEQKETKETKESAETKESPGQEKSKEEKKENKPIHRYHDRLSKAFPDRKFEKSEDYDSALDEHLDRLEKYEERGKKVNAELINIFETNPEIGAMLKDIKDGATVRQALARHFDPADLTPEEGDPDYEGWKKNKADREEKLTKRREFETQYANNLKAAEKELDDFMKENKLDDKTMEEFFDKTQAILDDFHNGKITKSLLTTVKRGLSWEADIKAAREEGVIAGRNEKIVAERQKESKEVGDGLPRVGQSSDNPDTSGQQEENYFAELRKRMEERGIINTDR